MFMSVIISDVLAFVLIGCVCTDPQSEFEAAIVYPCDHSFLRPCIDDRTNEHGTCPICIISKPSLAYEYYEKQLWSNSGYKLHKSYDFYDKQLLYSSGYKLLKAAHLDDIESFRAILPNAHLTDVNFQLPFYTSRAIRYKPFVDGTTTLLEACHNGNIEIVRLILEKYPAVDLNMQDVNKDTAISVATAGKYYNIVDLLTQNMPTATTTKTIPVLKGKEKPELLRRSKFM